ncbi:MAG: cyclic nucleotide-binding domain-containing protein [Deltaproteobacteria bacterium]|nr:cyclic nucleotide-binding domain-containing protein [Deltaproteobacteria bacterium]
MDSVLQQEQILDKYISEGNMDDAVKSLFNLITECAKKRDFIKAESLRDRLMEVAPLALHEITQSADIIDKEKSSSIDTAHHETWAALYSTLSPEEANILYFSMKVKTYDEGQIIFSLGERDNDLFFVDQGEAKMIYVKEGEELLLKNLKPGDITGEDTFFYATAYRTFTLKARTQIKLRSVGREILSKWMETSPDLETKIRSYCAKSGDITSLLEKKGVDRRINKRIKISGKSWVQLMKSGGAPMGKPFLGLLADMSEQGLAFSFKLTGEVPHKILGAKLQVRFKIPVDGSSKEIGQHGIIGGIGYPVLADHTIHVRFDQPDPDIKKLLEA